MLLFIFSVAYPQITTISPDTVDIVLHDTVQLYCSGHGSPQPSITWYHNNTVINATSTSTDHDIYTVHSTLVLANVSLYDAGVYTCIITNILSTIMKNITVDVTVLGMTM